MHWDRLPKNDNFGVLPERHRPSIPPTCIHTLPCLCRIMSDARSIRLEIVLDANPKTAILLSRILSSKRVPAKIEDACPLLRYGPMDASIHSIDSGEGTLRYGRHAFCWKGSPKSESRLHYVKMQAPFLICRIGSCSSTLTALPTHPTLFSTHICTYPTFLRVYNMHA